MHLGVFNFYQRNHRTMFESPDAHLGDDINHTAILLKQRLNAEGHEISILGDEPLASYDAVIFLDHPTIFNPLFRRLKRRHPKIPLYLVLFESKAVRPDNHWRSLHKPFKKVFTWSPELLAAGTVKYIPMQMPFKWPEREEYKRDQFPRKLCCMIASQKYSWAREELYTERIKTIRWFEEHHPDEFDLYGQRWDQFYFKGALSILNPVLAKIYESTAKRPKQGAFPSWCGPVKSKRGILRKYKFSICYENARYPGWFTEKALDAMFAGCVPVYWGEPNAGSFLPDHTFIDRRRFSSREGLYRFMRDMRDQEYERYRVAMHNFVHWPRTKPAPFSSEGFVDMIMKEVVKP